MCRHGSSLPYTGTLFAKTPLCFPQVYDFIVSDFMLSAQQTRQAMATKHILFDDLCTGTVPSTSTTTSPTPATLMGTCFRRRSPSWRQRSRGGEKLRTADGLSVVVRRTTPTTFGGAGLRSSGRRWKSSCIFALECIESIDHRMSGSCSKEGRSCQFSISA